MFSVGLAQLFVEVLLSDFPIGLSQFFCLSGVTAGEILVSCLGLRGQQLFGSASGLIAQFFCLALGVSSRAFAFVC